MDSFHGSIIELEKKELNSCDNIAMHFWKERLPLKSHAMIRVNLPRKEKLWRHWSYEKIENVLLKWYTDAQASKIPVNDVVIKEKAREILSIWK